MTQLACGITRSWLRWTRAACAPHALARGVPCDERGTVRRARYRPEVAWRGVANSVANSREPRGVGKPRWKSLPHWKKHDISAVMSDHGHAEEAHGHGAHDDHHDETTSDDFPADEPRSPAWLPLLGGVLLLAGVFACVMLSSEDKPADADGAPEPSAAAAPASANRPTAATRPVQAFPSMPKPAGHP